MTKRIAPPAATHPNADAFPHAFSGPALRAPSHAGLRPMAQLAQRSEDDVLALHGIGPKAIRLLREGPAKQQRHFRR
jgi:predicted flap endonuclease-1-like 5' DNA nuclease